MKRVLCILTAFVLLCGALFTGCSNSTSEDSTETTFGDNVVARVGDFDVTIDEINVFVGAIVPYVQQSTGAEQGWDQIVISEGMTARDVIIQYAVEEARYQYAFLDTAKKDGIYTDEMDEEFFNQYVTDIGGEEAYNQIIEEYGFNEDAFKKYISCTGAYYAVTNNLCSDEEADAIYNSEYITAKHILIQFEGRDNEEAAYAEAKAIYDRAISGESFEDLIVAHNEDPGLDVETGYTFGEGEMVDEFYQGSKALEIGGISEPVKTSYGYHIIKRYPLPEKDSEAYANYISTIKSSKTSEYLSEERTNAMLENYPLTINEDILSEIDLSIYTVTE